MMRYTLIILLLIVTLSLKGQRNFDYGILAGGASYMGELNSTNFVFSPSSAVGGFFRYNINPRYAARISGTYLGLSGNPANYPNQAIPNYLPQFAANILDFNAQVEFNFSPYMTGEEAFMRTLYVAGGVGFTYPLGSEGFLTIPFGLGYKINLTKRLSVGAEWTFRKTFSDTQLDNTQSILGNTWLNNNDWYSVYGLFISYKFVKFAADCPAYN